MDVLEVFNYCPRCKYRLIRESNNVSCRNCGLNYYDNPRPCTSVILYKENQYLLVERAFEPGKGFWDLPGGFVDVGETFEEGARREVKEELGIEIKELEYVTSATEPYPFKEVLYPTVAALFVAKLPASAKIKPADDVASYKLFDKNTLPKDKFAFKAMHKMFEAAAKLDV